jgi:hypothetical protein
MKNLFKSAITFLLILLFAIHNIAFSQNKKKKKSTNSGNVNVEYIETPTHDAYVDITEEPRMLDTLLKYLVYPIAAKKKKLEGEVLLDVLIDKQGLVSTFFACNDGQLPSGSLVVILGAVQITSENYF